MFWVSMDIRDGGWGRFLMMGGRGGIADMAELPVVFKLFSMISMMRWTASVDVELDLYLCFF